jgi:hypothetical protein
MNKKQTKNFRVFRVFRGLPWMLFAFVLNFGLLNFDIVSDFVLRASDLFLHVLRASNLFYLSARNSK